MRAAAVTALLVAALAAGCGGDEGEVKSTVSDVMRALARGDVNAVCEPIAPPAEKRLLEVLADNPLGYPDIKARSCREAIAKLHAQLRPEVKAILEEGEVDDPVVDGDKASVRVVGAGMTVDLQKIGDEWKIIGGLFDTSRARRAAR